MGHWVVRLVLVLFTMQWILGVLAVNVLVGNNLEVNPKQYLTSANSQYALVVRPDCNLVVYNDSQPLVGTNFSNYAPTPNCSLWMQYDGNFVIYNFTGVNRTLADYNALWSELTVTRIIETRSFLLLGDDGSSAFYDSNISRIQESNLFDAIQGWFPPVSGLNYSDFQVSSNTDYTAWKPNNSLADFPYMPGGYFLSAGQKLQTTNLVFTLELGTDCNLESKGTVDEGLWESESTRTDNSVCQLALQPDGSLQILDVNSRVIYWSSPGSRESIRESIRESSTVEDCRGSIIQPGRIPDFTGPFHSSGFASISPSGSSPVIMDPFIGRSNNLHANSSRGSFHVGRANFSNVAARQGTVIGIGRGAMGGTTRQGAVIGHGRGAMDGATGQGAIIGDTRANYGNRNFSSNYFAHGRGRGGNTPLKHGGGHSLNGVDVRSQGCFTTYPPSGHGYFGSGRGNIGSSFDKRSNLIQNQQVSSNIGPTASKGITSNYNPMVRLQTEVLVPGNSSNDQVRVETANDLISLSQSIDWGSMEFEQDSDEVVDCVAVVVPEVAAQVPNPAPIICASIPPDVASPPPVIVTSILPDKHDFQTPLLIGPASISGRQDSHTVSPSISSTIEGSDLVAESCTGKENIPLALVPLAAKGASKAGQLMVLENEDANVQFDVSRNPLTSLINGSFHKGVFNISVNYNNNVYKKSKKKKDRLV